MFRFLRSVSFLEVLGLVNLAVAVLLCLVGEPATAVLNVAAGCLLLHLPTPKTSKAQPAPPAEKPAEDWRVGDSEYAAWLDAREREFLDNPTPVNPFEPGSREWLEFEFGVKEAREDVLAFPKIDHPDHPDAA